MKIKRNLTLVGSGEFTKSMDETDIFLLELAKNNFNITNQEIVKVAIIPTAAGQEKDYSKWIEKGIQHFKNLGASPIGFDLLTKKDAENKKFIEKIKTCQIIYFSGGDPGYLFYSLYETEFWATIYNLYKNGAILCGSSAGAMVMGEYVFSNVYEAFESQKDPIWEKGFDFIPFSVIPHYDYVLKQEKNNFKRVLDKTSKNIRQNLLCINEDTALTINNEKMAEVTGKGIVYLIKNGKEKIYTEGKKFLITT